MFISINKFSLSYLDWPQNCNPPASSYQMAGIMGAHKLIYTLIQKLMNSNAYVRTRGK